jgi:hypothetical protein
MKNPPNWPAEKQSRKRLRADANRVPPSSVLSLGPLSLAASNSKSYIHPFHLRVLARARKMTGFLRGCRRSGRGVMRAHNNIDPHQQHSQH